MVLIPSEGAVTFHAAHKSPLSIVPEILPGDTAAAPPRSSEKLWRALSARDAEHVRTSDAPCE